MFCEYRREDLIIKKFAMNVMSFSHIELEHLPSTDLVLLDSIPSLYEAIYSRIVVSLIQRPHQLISRMNLIERTFFTLFNVLGGYWEGTVYWF